MTKHLITAIAFFIATISSHSQDLKNWFNESPLHRGAVGAGTDKVYETLLKDRKATPVIVAVIDGGTDVTHPDLVGNLWVNEKEIPGNGIDDDGNGYADDVHGWNFIGGKNEDVHYDNTEAVREYQRLKPVYEGKSKSGLTTVQKRELQLFEAARNKIIGELGENMPNLVLFEQMKTALDEILDAVDDEDGISSDDVASFESEDTLLMKIRDLVASSMNDEVSFDDIYKDVMSGYRYYHSAVNYHYNMEFDPRAIVNDRYEDYSERYYGNSRVAGPDATHGTHVAGIIGALRDNGVGINGVAMPVKLMIIRVVPDGDERDKDVANAIRYATDHGAKIINMSFGKPFSPGKKYVDEAVRYAASKDVLLVHAAGNDAANTDKTDNFPSPIYADTRTREPAWLEVGAISPAGQIADFSNYGRERVDLLAPGENIYSTMPGNTYDFENGTSMAAPVVSGVAALLRAYFPGLSAVETKSILCSSVYVLPGKTNYPGTTKKAKYKKLCRTGGAVNAYRAVEAALQP